MTVITTPFFQKRLRGHHLEDQARDVNMDRVASVVLGGGQGTRLFPLTHTRCKPAISFGGRYRLIDVPISNALNSGCNKIFIVTQFLSSSLHRHLLRTYQFSSFSSGFLDVLAAEQKPAQKVWFQGTADAVRQNLEYLTECSVDYFLILSGDQLYNLDFSRMLKFAREKNADLVVATTPVDELSAPRMGIMQVNSDSMIEDFHEKPSDKALLNTLRADPLLLDDLNLPPNSNRQYLGSMGIYLFKRECLIQLLQEDGREDFGKHLIPTQVKKGKTGAFLFDGYWEDIGTIESFYQANIALTQQNCTFNTYDEGNPIFTSQDNLCPPKFHDCIIKKSIICGGSQIEADEISNSIIGPRLHLKEGTRIRASYLMGNDFYRPPIQNSSSLPNDLSIGKNCLIQKTILDRNVHIGDHVELTNKNKLTHYNGDNIFIRDGIIIVMRGADIPNGFVL